MSPFCALQPVHVIDDDRVQVTPEAECGSSQTSRAVVVVTAAGLIVEDPCHGAPAVAAG